MEKYSPIILNSAGIKTAFDQNTFWSTLKVIVKHPPNIYRLLKHSWRRSSGHTFMISTKKWPILWPAYPHHPQKWKIDLFCKNNTVRKHVIYFKTLNPPNPPPSMWTTNVNDKTFFKKYCPTYTLKYCLKSASNCLLKSPNNYLRDTPKNIVLNNHQILLTNWPKIKFKKALTSFIKTFKNFSDYN